MSDTLTLLAKHKIKLTGEEADASNFIAELDQLLGLIGCEKRKLYGRKTMMPGVGIIWKVMPGSDLDKKRQAPIAYFFNERDMNRFIFGIDQVAYLEQAVERFNALAIKHNKLIACYNAIGGHDKFELVQGNKDVPPSV